MKMLEILKSLMEKHGDDPYSLERKSGVPQPTTHRFLSGKHGEPRPSTVRKWAMAYGLTESQLRGDVPLEEEQHGKKDSNHLIVVDDDSEFIPIKRVNLKISAGISGFAVEELNGDRPPIFFRRDWIDRKGLNTKSLFAIVVRGESMEPSLYDGDLVVINSDDKRQVEGEVFAFNYDGEVVIKRLHREAGLWYLASDNQDKRRYPNKLCHEQCLMLGRIIYKQSERI